MIHLGARATRNQRGVSNTIGIVLLFAMAILGALLVVSLGGSAADEVRQENDMEVAQQSMQDLSNRLSALKTGGDRTATFAFPDEMQGDTEVLRTTTINLTAYGDNACTTGTVDIATLAYENRDGELVGYEAGGVWRSYPDGGSVMVSPPEINYRNGRLQLSMSDINGQMSSQMEAQLNRTGTQRFNENLTRALFVDKTANELNEGPTGPVNRVCDPEDLERVSMELSGSPFSTAWYQYANDNFDSNRATITSSSGDPLRINFTLGNVQSPEFVVNDTNLAQTHGTNTALTVTPDIENTGGLGGTRNITVTVYEDTASGWQNVSTQHIERQTSIAGGDVETVTFGSDVQSSVFDTPGTYKVEIDTEDESANHTMAVATSPADVTVDISAPSDISATADEEVTAEFDNVGNLDTTRDFEFWFDGRLVETADDVYLPANDGAVNTTTFDIPTANQGQDLNATVIASEPDPDGARPRDEVAVSIGDNQYFDITGASLTGSTAAGDAFDVETTVENIGDTDGEDDVSMYVTHASNDTIAEDANGNPIDQTFTDVSLNAGQSKTRTFSVPAGIDDVGGYQYTIETSNETINRSFRVSTTASPYFVVTEVNPDPETVIRGNDIDVTALVNNTGASDGTQDIDAEFAGSPEDFAPDVSIDSQDGADVDLLVSTSDTMSPGYYDLNVSSANTSLTRTIHVVRNQSGTGIGDGGDTTINTTRNITASLTVLGTALTGYGDWDEIGESGREIVRAPVTMHIYTSNESVPNNRYYAWGPQTDLNTPSMRINQIEESPILNQTVTVGPGTSLSVFAESQYCDTDDLTDVDIDAAYGAPDQYADDDFRVFEYDGNLYGGDRIRCGFGGSRLNISRNQNPGNLKILNQTDSKIPNFEEAGVDQRSAADIIRDSSRVEINSTGHVQLDPDQRLLLYELSEPDAEYENADQSGDPDYNDAVVLFEVVEVETTQRTDPDFELLDTGGPAQVDMGDVADFNATVRNNGGLDGETYLEVLVDGSLVANESTGTIGGASNKTVDLPISTAGFSQGIKTVEIRLSNDENESETRNLYVGQQPRPYFVPNVDSAPTALTPGSEIEIDSVVTNVGGRQDTQNFEISIVGTTGALTPSSLTATSPESRSVTLDPGQDQSETFSFDTPTGQEGTVTFAISAENASEKRVTVAVEDPEFLIDSLYVGTDSYSEGETITDTNIDSLTTVVENPSRTRGQQDIRLRLDTDRDGAYEVDPKDSEDDVVLRNNATIANLALNNYGENPGVFDFQIATDDDTFEGTIRIRDTPDDFTPEESTESDLISIDLNKIELG